MNPQVIWSFAGGAMGKCKPLLFVKHQIMVSLLVLQKNQQSIFRSKLRIRQAAK
jgi:hypothetical protein